MSSVTIPGRYRFGHAMRMEWIKLRSLRSTAWAVVLVVVSMIAMGVVVMAHTRAPSSASARASFDPTNNVLAGVAIGQLVLGALGVLVMTGEYASGMIRATLAVIPNRPLLFAAKAAVFGAIALAVGEIVAFGAFFAGRAALAASVPRPELGQPGVARAVVLSGVYLFLVALLGLGLGAITRHTAAAIGAFVGVVFVLPLIAEGVVGPSVSKYFPTMIAGNSMGSAKPVENMLSPWAGSGVMCGYAVLVLGVGGWLLSRRDA